MLKMFTGREQLRFGQHKDAIAAVVKLRAVNGTSGIPLHQMRPCCFLTTNQNAVIGQITAFLRYDGSI